MSRYIDADAYAAELWKLRENYQMLDDTHTADKIMHGIFRAEQVLKEQPSVDAVPVTRCAQCKWCDYPVPNSTKYGCRLFDRCVKGDWFCADGERRTDEQQT